jgi:hypothetical protein
MKLPKELIAYIQQTDILSNLLLSSTIPASIYVKNTELDHRPINVMPASSANREAVERVKSAYLQVIDELTAKGVL